MLYTNGNRFSRSRRFYSKDFASVCSRAFGKSIMLVFGLIYVVVSMFINVFIQYGKFEIIKLCVENGEHWEVVVILSVDAVINFVKAVNFVLKYL